MNNLLRTLVFDGQVSLTLADTTEMVNESIKRHALSSSAAIVLGKALSAMTYMSACLKMDTGEISLSVQSDGTGGNIGISGNRALHLRGYIENVGASGDEEETLGKNGSLTIIRDDGYNRPFVGTCALAQGGVDKAFEEYYRISEQLPTYLKTAVELDENGRCVFAGVAVLQPLPFADEAVLLATREVPLEQVLKTIQAKGVEECVNVHFKERSVDDKDGGVWEMRRAKYKCNCSREYLQRVLITLGKQQVDELIQENGAVRVHCHYCNFDYAFTQEDVDELFERA